MSIEGNNEDFSGWIGRSEDASDIIAPMRVAELNATLDRDDGFPSRGDALPALYHWMFGAFLGLAKTSDLGSDGHPRRGLFLPPIRLPRRMWAASDVTFHAPLSIGEDITRHAVIENIEDKAGRSGRLTFVTVRHDYSGPAGLALTDRQTIVYREAPAASERGKEPTTKPAPDDAAFSRRLVPDVAMLFRYSALIFNAHRIHFDQPFVTEEEGYPGLVVHGPLIATLLADLLRRERPEARIARIRFRAAAPLFAAREMTVAGRETETGYRLWAANDAGGFAAEADIETRD
jgi:3-methylfumaryl-CoA hydratase